MSYGMDASSSDSIDSNSDGSNERSLGTVLDTINLHLNEDEASEVRVDMEGLGESSHRHQHAHTHQTEARPQGNQAFAVLMPYFTKFGAFILIILLKILYSHRYGLLILIGTVATWYNADRILTTQITLRSHVRHTVFASKVSWVIVFLSASLFGIYYFLDENHNLAGRLFLSTAGLELGIEIWVLLWHLLITDYAVKYCTIIIKSLLALIPKSMVSYQLKGRLYMLIERVTQLYRSILPTVPWYFFLMSSSDGPWFSAVLFIAYVVCKFLSLYSQWSPLKASVLRVFTSQESYGRRPTSQEMEEIESTCPVCHDEFTDPLMLLCKHVFCEDCVLVWFDKETSCPMCRTKIIMGDNSYRDGSSSWTVQFF
ncbi:RING finger and transmembrane domain-containing protein 2-like [Watersipora subatra]|uniref:RING finger and transmembrane domain-containing protein 2-like n=1 Tax=Watersipora subatra TaxID=2589382 RepID=UPI00355C63C4